MGEEPKRSSVKRSSSVAWFKIAELISRGEKEKALNLYRLLSHSFEDRAYVLQVEGDILWAFEDEAAIDRYKRAAEVYRKERKIACAVAVYEHLLTLQPKQYEHLARLVVLYAELKWTERLTESFNFLLDIFDSNDISQEAMHKAVEDVVLAFSQDSQVGTTDEKKHNEDSFQMFKLLLKKKAPDLAEKVTVLYPKVSEQESQA